MKPRNCREIREWIVEGKSGTPLNDNQWKAIQRHVAKCGACRAFQQDVSRVLAALRKTDPLPESFFEEIKTNILEAVAPKTLRRQSPTPGVLPWLRALFSRHPLWGPIASGAFGVMMGFALATALPRLGEKAVRLAGNSALSLTANVSGPSSGPVLDIGNVSAAEIEEYMGSEALLDFLESQGSASSLEIGDLPDLFLTPQQNKTG